MDANFSLINLLKNCDPDDVSLWNGRGYFVEEEPFLQYVKEHEHDKEEVRFFLLLLCLEILTFVCRRVHAPTSTLCNTTSLSSMTSREAAGLWREYVGTVSSSHRALWTRRWGKGKCDIFIPRATL